MTFLDSATASLGLPDELRYGCALIRSHARPFGPGLGKQHVRTKERHLRSTRRVKQGNRSMPCLWFGSKLCDPLVCLGLLRTWI